MFWLLWLLVAERYGFRPDLATTILGVSLTVNVVLLGVLVQRRP